MIEKDADVVEQRVDREIAAERVLFRRAEGVVVVDGVGALRRRLVTARRDERDAVADCGARRRDWAATSAGDGASASIGGSASVPAGT